MLTTIQAIRTANENADQYFFDAATLRHWRSRVSVKVYPVPNGALFVTSETDEDSPREYTVRFAHDSGRVETVGTFMAWPSRKTAHRAAERLAGLWTDTALPGTYRWPRTGQETPVVVLADHWNGLVRLAFADGWGVLDGGKRNLV